MTAALRILIASTPKTGNTWLRHLMSFLYEVPSVEMGTSFSVGEANRLGERWVCQQHLFPESALLAWAEDNGVVILTALRHPADTLLSLWSYVRRYAGDPTMDIRLVDALTPDARRPGPNVAAYAREAFPRQLAVSVAWVRSGRSLLVRYEDLRSDPVGTLGTLAAAISDRVPGTEVAREAIERAVALAELDTLRTLPGVESKFFGEGVVGGARKRLPSEIFDLFRTTAPYPAQFAALGYSLYPDDPSPLVSRVKGRDRNPFRGVERLEDGVPVVPLLVRAWLSLPESFTSVFRATGGVQDAGSFAAWLNAPARGDPSPGKDPLVTNLLAFIHRIRPGFSKSYPQPFGADREDLVIWFHRFAEREYGLDEAFVAPVEQSWRRWAASPADGGQPLVTNLAMAFHRHHPGVRDPLGADRLKLMLWFLNSGPAAEQLDADLSESIRTALAAWAAEPADGRLSTTGAGPVITNLAMFVHDESPDIAEAFPDPLGADRSRYFEWMELDGQIRLSRFRMLGVRVSERSFAWANAPAAADPLAGKGVPLITNLMAQIPANNTEVAEQFPDLFGRHRIDFASWVLTTGATLYFLTPPYLLPLLSSWAADPGVLSAAARKIGRLLDRVLGKAAVVTPPLPRA